MKKLHIVQSKILNFLENYSIKRNGYPIVQLNLGKKKPRALFMYISRSFTWKDNDPRFIWHESLIQSKLITQILIENGYQIDLVDMKDSSFSPKVVYDLFIGHGYNALKIAEKFGKNTRKIFLNTGQYVPYKNKKILGRYNQLMERKGIMLKPIFRSNIKKKDYLIYDEIACFGNSFTAATFKPVGMKVHTFINYANPQVRVLDRNWSNVRRNFVYMSARNDAHIIKGLDILIDVFSTLPDCVLYICGKFSGELKDIYKNELKKSPNIHCCGYVRMGEDKWQKISANSAWYISPSSSEGMQGAVLNAMASGLVPIITRDVGIDIGSEEIILDNCSIEEVTAVVKICAEIPAEKIREKSMKIIEKNRFFNQDNFIKDWNKIIQNT